MTLLYIDIEKSVIFPSRQKKKKKDLLFRKEAAIMAAAVLEKTTRKCPGIEQALSQGIWQL